MQNIRIVIFIIIALFAGCERRAVDPPTVPLRQVADDLGRTVVVPVDVKRAVSLAPSVTESIYAIGAEDRLVGVTSFCDYPEAAKSIAKVGDTMTPNLETIVALKPDVVFVSTASQIEAFTRTLDDNGIAVFVMSPNNLQDVYRNLNQLGIIFDNAASVFHIVQGLQRREVSVRSAVHSVPSTGDPILSEGWHRPSVFVQISREPLFTIGKESFITRTIQDAGGRSVTADVATAYPKLSKETAAVLNPEVIILSDSDDNRDPNEVFRSSPAVRDGRVYRINADILSRPGPRLVDALEQIARVLHPKVFSE